MLTRFVLLQTMVYREDTLVSGALEALVRHAIPTSDYFPEDAYLFAFLLCSRLFAPLNDVLVRVIRAMDRCKVSPRETRSQNARMWCKTRDSVRGTRHHAQGNIYS